MLRRAAVFACLLALLLPGLAGCAAEKPSEFALYLLHEDMATADFQAADLDALDLRAEPLIASADIHSYTRSSQDLQLTPAAYQRVRDLFGLPVDVDGIPFVVCVGQDRIYGGAFWTPVSSLSHARVVVMDDHASNPNHIQFSLGYPSSEAFSGSDPRDSEKIIQALQAAGKLQDEP